MPEPPCRVIACDAAGCRPHVLAQVDAIFWETTLHPPEQPSEREAFRERWLGRYLCGGSDILLLAVAGHDTVAGYLVGTVESPAGQPRFDDIGYFRGAFAHLLPRFPAHLHVNLAAEFRNRGLGSRLIESFAERARNAGAPGMHVVTGQGMRNVRFYRRSGFVECALAPWKGGTLVFLGREL